MQPYDWRKTTWKAAKTALVAFVAYAIADPALMPAILQAIPASYRMLAMVLLPALWSALRNWIKNSAVVGF